MTPCGNGWPRWAANECAASLILRNRPHFWKISMDKFSITRTTSASLLRDFVGRYSMVPNWVPRGDHALIYDYLPTDCSHQSHSMGEALAVLSRFSSNGRPVNIL